MTAETSNTRIKQSQQPADSNTALWIGILFSLAFTVLIWVLRPIIIPQIDFAPDTGFSHYFWKLPDPTVVTRISAWTGYLLHQVTIWYLIYRAQTSHLTYSKKLHRVNILALGANAFFVVLHVLQTSIWYDGLAQDVSILSSQGSVILMLVMVLLMENQRRGLFFGKKIGFLKQSADVVKRYHGYVFSWAIIYTFWYHPIENTGGHLMGLLYTFLLLLQGSLFYTRSHVNRWWMVTQEVMVLVHGSLVAYVSQVTKGGPMLWPMFFFGFAALFVVTQMYGLRLKKWTRWSIIAGFILLVFLVYNGRWADTNEIIRIPVIEYGLVFVLALLIQIGIWVNRLVRGPDKAKIA